MNVTRAAAGRVKKLKCFEGGFCDLDFLKGRSLEQIECSGQFHCRLEETI